jgi:hypothetical protein
MRHPSAHPLRVEYCREPDVSEGLDRELRELIAGCFPQPELYTSSGCRPLDAAIRRFNPAEQAFETGPIRVALYKPLTERAWPQGPVDLRGPMF